MFRFALGCGISCVMVSSSGIAHELLARLELVCTNNQAEYEALVAGLEWLVDMKLKHVEPYGNSQLVVQQVLGESQFCEGTLHRYRECCMQLIKDLDTFNINHINRERNKGANGLAQQASGYEIKRGKFIVKE
jgi:ribonuclease HI